MKLGRALCLATSLALAAPAAAQDLTLWQNVSYGMTRAEVQAAQPEATSTPGADRLSNGATCDLRLVTYRAGTDNFRVCFYFLNDHLHQFTMGFIGRPFRGDFDEILTLLSARYGRPLSTGPSAIGMDADWLLPNQTSVTVIYIDRYKALINIFYQRRLANEANRF